MMKRRDLIKGATFALAGSLWPAAVWSGRAAVDAPLPSQDLLAIADSIARWIDKSAQTVDGMGVRWPMDPLTPARTAITLYSGTSGIVYFLAALGHYSGDAHWTARARAGADYIAASLAQVPEELRDAHGLYTGQAGAAWLLARLAPVLNQPAYLQQAKRTARHIAGAASPVGQGVEWSDIPDITMGGAGIGLFLLQAGRAWQDDSLIQVAEQAGQRLIELSERVDGGLMWTFDRSTLRNYPNFSHGTAGVAYYLAELYQQTGRQAYLDAALEGAAYLEHIAHRQGDAAMVFHRADGGLDRFYVGWCHGPVGTSRLFYRLHQITGDARHRQSMDALIRGLQASGAPFRPSSGYWNNVGQCCGNAGIAQFYIDLIRHWDFPVTEQAVVKVMDNAQARASHDADALPCWVHAESRDKPDDLMAQTGFMQGSAGMGTVFLQLHALREGLEWQFPFPDTPFASRPAL